jgi:hypothetical protein
VNWPSEIAGPAVSQAALSDLLAKNRNPAESHQMQRHASIASWYLFVETLVSVSMNWRRVKGSYADVSVAADGAVA